MRRRPPLKIGSEYNDWTVIKQINLNRVICKCKCGIEQEISITHMITGRSKRCRTCGNSRPSNKWRSDNFENDGIKYPIKLKTAATDAIRRCTDRNNDSYQNYGGRGIKIYESWLSNPKLFVEYLMTLQGWEDPNLMLDRINNDGDYEPGNLRWVTPLESGRNQRHNKPAIMTTDQVIEAKELRSKDPKTWTYKKLGERYNVVAATVFLAVTGRTWKHLQKDKV